MKSTASVSSDQRDRHSRIAAGLAALAHPARLEIIRSISGSGACSCKDIVSCLDLAQSTVSQHLKVLVDAGLLTYAAERQRSRYEINRDCLSDLTNEVVQIAASCCRPRGGC